MIFGMTKEDMNNLIENNLIHSYYCRHCGNLMRSARMGNEKDNTVRDWHLCTDDECRWFVSDRYYRNGEHQDSESNCYPLADKDVYLYYSNEIHTARQERPLKTI